jgi:hypothetical protein
MEEIIKLVNKDIYIDFEEIKKLLLMNSSQESFIG